MVRGIFLILLRKIIFIELITKMSDLRSQTDCNPTLQIQAHIPTMTLRPVLPRQHLLKRFFSMYREGFRAMTIGRTLWAIVIVKLIVIFGILKIFFFPDILQRDYPDDEARAEAVRTTLTKPDRL